MNDKLDKDRELLQKILDAQMTEVFLQKVHNEERNLNEKKYEAFKSILLYFKNSFKDDESVTIRFGLLDQFNPRSGWISVSGPGLVFYDFAPICDYLKEVSNISVEMEDEERVELSIMMYEIVELV